MKRQRIRVVKPARIGTCLQGPPPVHDPRGPSIYPKSVAAPRTRNSWDGWTRRSPVASDGWAVIGTPDNRTGRASRRR